MAGRGRPRKPITEAADIGRIYSPPPELKHFDDLPDAATVRLPVVRGLYGNASASAIWRNVKQGAIPAPVKLTSNITAWRVGELRAALTKGAA